MATASEPLLSQTVPTATVSRTLRKLDARVLMLSASPILFCGMDRSYVGFAARELCPALKLNHQQYGLGACLFGVGYIPVQFFGNSLFKRFGGPAWLTFILLAWGCIASSMSLIRTARHFYVLRFLLGLAEGGIFPAVFYYLSNFYPASHQTGPYSVVTGAVSLAMPFASPIAAGLLSLDGLFGVDGWRYVFAFEGLLPIFCALMIYALLPESPDKATFLVSDERQWLLDEHSEQRPDRRRSYFEDIKCAVKNKTWWIVCVGGFPLMGVCTVLTLWIALIIHNGLYGEDDEGEETCGSKNGNATTAVLLTAIPYVLSSAMCIAVYWFDNKIGIRNRPRFSFLVTCFSGLAMISWIGAREVSFVLGFIVLTVAIGTHALSGGCTIGLVMSQFDSETSATCIGVGNLFHSLGPLIYPPIVGAIVDARGYAFSMLFLGVSAIFSGTLSAFASDPLMK